MDTIFQHTNITLSGPGELLAGIPHMIGFHPVDSLVAVCLTGDDADIIQTVARIDLPTPDHYLDVAAQLIVLLAMQDASGAVLVIVGGEPGAGGDLVAECRARLTDAGIETRHAIWASSSTSGATWRCYDEADCFGTVPDLVRSALAGSTPVHERREDVVATLAPVDDDALARRGDLLAAVDLSTTDTRAALDMVEAAIDRAVAGTLPESDDDIVALAVALCDHAVRDACLGQAEQDRADAAERLWIALVRATPAPERAEPASLLAFSAYQRGDGVLARIALDHADSADPSHQLTQLLSTALSIGVQPERMRRAGKRAAVLAREQIADAEGGDQP